MGLFLNTALISAAVFGLPVAYAEPAWTVTVYQGLRCTGLRLDTLEKIEGVARECREIDPFNQAGSVLFSVSDSAKVGWEFGINKKEGCLDFQAAGNYDLYPGAPSVCAPTEGAGLVSVEPSRSGPALSVRDPGTIAARQDQEFFDWVLGRGPIVSGGIAVAINRCSKVDLNEPASEIAAECGLAVITTVIYAVFAVYERRAQISRRNRLNPPRRDVESFVDLYDEVFGLLESAPSVSRNVIAGVETTVGKLDGTFGDSLLHLLVETKDLETGLVSNAFVDFDPTSNHTLVMADNPNRSLADETTSLAHDKRQISAGRYTAYYAYDDFDFDIEVFLPIHRATANRLGKRIYNYIVADGSEKASFCGNLAGPNDFGIPVSVNRGHWAYITGSYLDQSSECGR